VFPVPYFILENINIDDDTKIVYEQSNKKIYSKLYNFLDMYSDKYNYATMVQLKNKYTEKIVDIIVETEKDYYCFDEVQFICQKPGVVESITQSIESINETKKEFQNLKQFTLDYFGLYRDNLYPMVAKIFKDFNLIKDIFLKYTFHLKSQIAKDTYNNLVYLFIHKLKNHRFDPVEFLKNNTIFYTEDDCTNDLYNFFYKNYSISLYETNSFEKPDCSLNTRIVYRLGKFYHDNRDNKDLVLSFLGLMNNSVSKLDTYTRVKLNIFDAKSIVFVNNMINFSNYKSDKINELQTMMKEKKKKWMETMEKEIIHVKKLTILSLKKKGINLLKKKNKSGNN